MMYPDNQKGSHWHFRFLGFIWVPLKAWSLLDRLRHVINCCNVLNFDRCFVFQFPLISNTCKEHIDCIKSYITFIKVFQAIDRVCNGT